MSEASHIVKDNRGRELRLRERPAQWLLEQGLIELLHASVGGRLVEIPGRANHSLPTEEQVGPGVAHFYRPTGIATVKELNETIQGQAELRDCDFCLRERAPWRVTVQPFDQGPDRFTRPVFCCKDCADLLSRNRWRQLTKTMIDAKVRVLREQGEVASPRPQPNRDRLTRKRIRASLTPQCEEFVEAVRANRRGWPKLDGILSRPARAA